MTVKRQEQQCDSTRNLDKGKERTEAKQQINGEIIVVHDQLVKIKSEITELKTNVADIKEELQNLRLENKGLQKQLEHILTSNENEYKLSERELESTNVNPHNISEQEIDLMQRTDLQGEVDIKFKMSQHIENQMSELSYKVYRYNKETLLNFRDKLLYSQQITER